MEYQSSFQLRRNTGGSPPCSGLLLLHCSTTTWQRTHCNSSATWILSSLKTSNCCGLISIPPKFLRWSPNPQCDCIWSQGLRGGDKRLVPLQEEKLVLSALMQAPMKGHPSTERRLPTASRDKSSPGTKRAGALTLDSQPPELREVNCWCLSHAGSGALLWQPEYTDTATLHLNTKTSLYDEGSHLKIRNKSQRLAFKNLNSKIYRN